MAVRRKRKGRRVETSTADLKLPTERKKPDLDPLHYTGMIYGREKIGKTTWLSQWPEILFLTTEPGTKGLEIFEEEIPDWTKMLRVVRALEREKTYKTVAIDTADLAYDMCLDYVCKSLGIPYPGVDASGDEDWGKSWKAVKDEFTDVVARILRTGRGLWFTSHARERRIKTRSGDRYDRIGPSMGRQPSSVVEALVDIYFYADYMRTTKGKTIRVLVCEGDETVWAGHRKTAGEFPALLPMPLEGAYEDFVRAFRGEHPGINPRTLMAHRTTSPSLTELVRKIRKETGKEESPKRTLKKTAKRRPARRR